MYLGTLKNLREGNDKNKNLKLQKCFEHLIFFQDEDHLLIDFEFNPDICEKWW